MPVTAQALLPEVSQHALSRLDQCERLFELAHLQRVNWPAPDPMDDRPDVRARLELGTVFHRLVHWHARGYAVDPLLDMLAEVEGLADIRGYWADFLASPHATSPEACWSEQTLRVAIAGLRVVVRYDRLVRHDDGRWVILDWKTGRRFDAASAASNWQTRLYRLALVAGGQVFNGGRPIAPTDVTVVYWHVPSGESHSYPYSESLRAEDEAALEKVAGRLAEGLEAGFAPNASHCERCVYQTRCQLALERPAEAESPIVWPTFKFPD